jgi:large subunit ribosomal protein L35
MHMPKMKTHRGAAKRFKVTGTGKIMRRRAFRKHLFENKPSTRTRRLKPMVVVASGNETDVRRMLGR